MTRAPTTQIPETNEADGWMLHPINEAARLVAKGVYYKAKFYRVRRSANAAKGYWESRGAFFAVCSAVEHLDSDGRFTYGYFYEKVDLVETYRVRPFGGRR